jgi:hypothetical protein
MSDSFEVRDKVAAFATYEDYLESQISELDMFYLESEEVARQLVELGYRAYSVLGRAGPRFCSAALPLTPGARFPLSPHPPHAQAAAETP